MVPKSRKAVQSEATRGELMKVARALFAERGFAGTATEEIAERAGVTRGALYHHFRDKEDLFRAVYEEVEMELAEKVVARTLSLSQATRLEQLRAGAEAFLDACLDPAVQQIALVDAPSVLGWETWRAIDAQYGFGLLRGGLQAAIDAGEIVDQPAGPLAHLLLGALDEAALLIARADDVKAARSEVGAAVLRLLDGLRAKG
ncbi:MAG: helix-turn-helix domain-containing protein [Dehalococcoidia bacterium]